MNVFFTQKTLFFSKKPSSKGWCLWFLLAIFTAAITIPPLLCRWKYKELNQDEESFTKESKKPKICYNTCTGFFKKKKIKASLILQAANWICALESKELYSYKFFRKFISSSREYFLNDHQSSDTFSAF